MYRRKGRGAIFIQDSFTVETNDLFSDCYCQSISINKTQTYDLVNFCLYKPPHASILCFTDSLMNVKSFIHQCHPDNILMMDDFNFPYVNWSTYTLKTGACISTSNRDSVNEFLLSHLLLVPTRFNKKIPDLVLSNYTNIIPDITFRRFLHTKMPRFILAAIYEQCHKLMSTQHPITAHEQNKKSKCRMKSHLLY